jgi:hypothetical protein
MKEIVSVRADNPCLCAITMYHSMLKQQSVAQA